MTKNRTPTPVYLDPGMHPGLEVKGLRSYYCLPFKRQYYCVVLWGILLFKLIITKILRNLHYMFLYCNFTQCIICCNSHWIMLQVTIKPHTYKAKCSRHNSHVYLTYTPGQQDLHQEQNHHWRVKIGQALSLQVTSSYFRTRRAPNLSSVP